MPAWIAILLALMMIYTTITPSRKDYAWYLQLRRPRWFNIEQHIPFIGLGLYVFFFNSARLVLEPQWKGGYATGFLLLVAMAQGTSWLTCSSRSLQAGVVLGILAWLWNLGMILALLPVSTTAALLLVPYLLWGPVVIAGRHQMRALNAGSGGKPGRRSLADKP